MHPNDHVNMQQSSIDSIPTAMHISAAMAVKESLIPALEHLQTTLEAKAKQFADVVKIDEYHKAVEEIPAYGSVLLRLANLAYLRTVIVTAAVYGGFGCKLQIEILTCFLNLPAPSRRHSVYILLRVSTELCF